MSEDVFTLHCSGLPSARLVGFRGSEIINQPFELDVFFTVPEGTDVKPAIGATTTVTANRKNGGTNMAWHGIFVHLRLLHQTAERALYHGLLVPKLWLLRQYVRSHVQTKKGQKVRDFCTVTLKDGGLTAGSDFEFSQLDDGNYPEEEFVCQYRESHLDFVHRWFEREGLYYLFEHAAAESGTPKMLVLDQARGFTPLLGDGVVRYVPQTDAGNAQGDDCFVDLHVDMRLLPASVAIVDHNYANPNAPVNGKQPVLANGQGSLHEYGYRVFDSGHAARLAEVKAQAIKCREVVLNARGSYLGVRAGYDFEIEDGPAEYPKKWLATEVRHVGVVSGQGSDTVRYTGLGGNLTYEVAVTAIPSDVQFRAKQQTPWPRIYGYEHGSVDGPATSQYAQIDEQGRYLVRFRFDTADLPDGSTSTYLRMMQPHGGNPEGFHFPLRKGTEVVVAFLSGDPDRPIIAGVVPDAHRPSLVTSRNHTQNMIRTGGRNHMVIEDLDGQQSIDIFSPEKNTNFYMGHPREEKLVEPPEEKKPGSKKEEEVMCSAYLHTDGNAGFTIGGDWWQTVGANQLVYVDGKAMTQVHGESILSVDGDAKMFYNAKLETEIASGWKDTIASGGVVQTIEAGGWKQEVTGDSEQAIKGKLTSSMSAGWEVEKTPKVEWTIGQKVEISAGDLIELKAAEVKIEATSFHGHWEPHKFEMIGALEEFVINEAKVVALKEEAVGAEAVFVGAGAHFYGAFAHFSGAHFDNHLAHVQHSVAHLKDAVTKLENTPATIINSVTFIKNTAILVIT